MNKVKPASHTCTFAIFPLLYVHIMKDTGSPHFSVLQVTESWPETGNKAMGLCNLSNNYSTPIVHKQSVNPCSLKQGRPRCHTKLPTAQET